jgi:hypothetical protein
MRTRKSARADQKTTRPAGRAPTAERHPRAAQKEARAETLAQLALDLSPATQPAHADVPAGLRRGPVLHAVPTSRADASEKASQHMSGNPNTASAMRRHFGELRAALAEGWEIVQPIFARPLWSATDDSATAFNFVLRGPHGTRLITVPQDRRVERFIRDHQLQVDHVR